MKLIVFAAASLTECLDDLAAEFEKDNPDVQIKANYAGTQELRIQVEQGATCDVFISASQHHMEALVAEGHVVEPQVIAHNTLCVAVDPHSKAVTSLADLAKPGVRVVVATPTCPAGRYTRECWKKMGAAAEFGPRFVAGLTRNVVSQETNVKLVLAKVVLGEADACFVYSSDVLGQRVTRLDLPESVQVTATYFAGRGKDSPHPQVARRYLHALLGKPGAAALAAAGLTPAQPATAVP